MRSLICLFLAIFSVGWTAVRAAGDIKTVHPLAIFAFEERGTGVKGMGAKVSDLLFAALVTQPELVLVDRADLDKLMEEQKLNLSGLVRPDQAVSIGQLTGAKILITGTVLEADDDLVLVAKVIGTETSRVLGASVKARLSDSLPPLVEQLAAAVAGVVGEHSSELVAAPQNADDRLAAIRKALGDAKRPTVAISIGERHVGRPTSDPAAETEMASLCRETGFEVVDASRGGRERAEILLIGEGFSEFAGTRSELITVKARVEVKAIERATGRLLAADHQTILAVDLAEQMAGKAALQQASAKIAERLLPKLVKAE